MSWTDIYKGIKSFDPNQMGTTGWCAFHICCFLHQVDICLLTDINFIFRRCQVEIEDSRAPKNTDLHTSEAHLSQNDFWEIALLRQRKASDKLFKLKCFHMVISTQWLLKKSTSVFKIASLQSCLEQGIEKVASANCKVVHFRVSRVLLLWFYRSSVTTVLI